MAGRHEVRYVSEFTQFMNEFLAHHPEVAEDQQRGRSLYWDKKVEAADLERKDVPVDGYYYFGKF